MIENRIKFFQFLIDLEAYLIEFNFKKRIKEKNYLLGCKIEGINWQPIISIVYDKYTFSANNKKRYILQMVGNLVL